MSDPAGREARRRPDRGGYGGRLLAEAVRVHEELHGEAPERPEELEHLRASDAPLEERIVRRARGLASSAPLAEALERLGQTLRGAFLAGALVAAGTGAGAAHAALGFGRAEPINVFLVLGALLLAQSAFLLLSLVLLAVSPAASALGALGGSLGGGLVALARRWFRHAHPGEHAAAAAGAWSEVVLRSPIGKWTALVLSNGLWAAFDLGALAALFFLLSTRHYGFVWETTIQTRESIAGLVAAAGALPGALGFPVPDRAAVEATLWREAGTEPSEATRLAWSGFLLGCVTVYGLLPRLVLLTVGLVLRRRAAERYRLDLSRAGFARLRARLQPAAGRLGVVDPEERAAEAGARARAAHGGRPTAPVAPVAPMTPGRPLGDPAVVGLELEPPAAGWPPLLDGVRWRDLGRIDDGRARRAAAEDLARSALEPSHLVFVCALATTPDRGVRGFLEELGAAAGGRRVLVLTGGQALRRRTDAEGVRRRVEDWRRLARELGFEEERVLELDLDHLTRDGVRELLAALDRGAEGAGAPGRHVEAAFGLVAARAEGWSGAPPPRELAELQREIAALYGAPAEGPRGLRALLRIPAGAPGETAGELAARLGSGARRTLELLPARLQASPRWIAAGALAGAAACLATSLAAGPAALAVLPTWSAVGGALGGVLRAWRGSAAPGTKELPEAGLADPGFGDAVRAAALLALLLELQGRGEERITRLLDAALPADDPRGEALDGPRAVRPWLDEVRHRLDLALAAEARS